MLYPWFIFLLIFLTARPWAERRSCSTLGVFFVYFFNLAAMGRERFLIYPWFIIMFFVLLVNRPKLLSARIRMTQLIMFIIRATRPNRVRDFESRNLWCALAKSSWNFNTGKMLRILVPLMRVKTYFFGFIEALDFKRILNILRIGEICWRCSFDFLYVTNKLVLILFFLFSRYENVGELYMHFELQVRSPWTNLAEIWPDCCRTAYLQKSIWEF